MPVIIECGDGAERDRAVAAARAAARRGDIVIVPTESVYAIATDAFSDRGVRAVREAKGYAEGFPLPVMVASRTTVSGIAARLGDGAKQLMQAFWPGPLTILLQAQPSLAWDLPSDSPLAVRMPMHPLLLALLEATGPMVVTSAGLPGLSDPATATAALAQAGSSATVVLDAGTLAGSSTVADDVDGSDATTGAGDTSWRSTVVDARTEPAVVLRPGSITADRIREACPGVVD